MLFIYMSGAACVSTRIKRARVFHVDAFSFMTSRRWAFDLFVEIKKARTKKKQAEADIILLKMLRNEIENVVDTSEINEFVERKTKRIFKEIGAFRTQNKWAIEGIKSLETRKFKACRALDLEQEDEKKLTFNVNGKLFLTSYDN